MPEKGVRSTYSQCPFEIEMHNGEGLISTGTAFYYENAGKWFIITNWHNLSGKHFLTKELLDKKGGRVPTHIEAKLHTYIDPITLTALEIPDSKGTFAALNHKIPIYDKCGVPLWFEHPELGSDCDVIALPFSRPHNTPENMHNAANLISNSNTSNIPVSPGTTVFIVGFPHGISTGPNIPIHKSGYIASEPHYKTTIEGKKFPAFLIDSQTKQGMSGSPVFARYTGTWDMTNPYREIDPDASDFWERDDIALGGVGTQFIGCYSGRLNTNNKEDVALGLCWGKDIIQHICVNKYPGRTKVI